MHTDFTLFDDSKHMLEWLTDEPERMILETVEEMLGEQLPGAAIHQFVVTHKPQWLSRGRKGEQDEEELTLVGTGTAFAVSITIAAPDGSFPNVNGILSIVAYDMNTPDQSTRVWFDVNGSLEEFGSNGALMRRVYEEQEDA